jgi:hypothetical protein
MLPPATDLAYVTPRVLVLGKNNERKLEQFFAESHQSNVW